MTDTPACGRLRAAAAIVGGLLAVGCATPRGSDADPLPAVVQGAAGRYDNFIQLARAPSEWNRPPAAGNPYDWLDGQHAEFVWVEAPQLGPHVMYLEWRAGSDLGPISRQRIWLFRRDASGKTWRMDFYTLKNPPQFAGRSGEAGAFAGLTAADLIGYGDNCALEHSRPPGVEVFVIPKDCRIRTQSGRDMSIAAEIRFQRDRIGYREAGTLPDGSYAFLVPGKAGLFYEFSVRP